MKVQFETFEELGLAFLGFDGDDVQEQARQNLTEGLQGEFGEDHEAAYEEFFGSLKAGLDSGDLTFAEAGESVEEDVDQAELEAAEGRMQALADEDQSTARITSELERLAEYKGVPLSPEEAKRAVAAIPADAYDGGPIPDLVEKFGAEVKDRSNPEQRKEIMLAAARKSAVDRDPDVGEEISPDPLVRKRLEAADPSADLSDPDARAALMVNAGIANSEAREHGATREESFEVAHRFVSEAGDDDEGDGEQE